jgi:hypothetical protein
MCRFYFSRRKEQSDWKRKISIHIIGLTMCFTILCVTVYEKFLAGGWLTLVVTGIIILLCFWVKRHYKILNSKLATLYTHLANIPKIAQTPPGPVDPAKPTAAVLVGGYNGLGIHTVFAAFREFPNQFKNVVFLSVGVVDSGIFKGEKMLDELRTQTEDGLKKYVALIEGQGIPATYRMAIGTDVVAELESLCLDTAKEFHQATFFAGQLVFQQERWYHPILHNETAFVLQKKLQLSEHTLVIMPARIK